MKQNIQNVDQMARPMLADVNGMKRCAKTQPSKKLMMAHANSETESSLTNRPNNI